MNNGNTVTNTGEDSERVKKVIVAALGKGADALRNLISSKLNGCC